MSPKEKEELLIRIDERVETIFKVLEKLPCNDHQDEITKHDERINTHSKFLWGYFTSTLALISGFVLLAYKTIFKP